MAEEFLQLLHLGFGLLDVGLRAIRIFCFHGLLRFGDVGIHARFGGGHVATQAQALRRHRILQIRQAGLHGRDAAIQLIHLPLGLSHCCCLRFRDGAGLRLSLRLSIGGGLRCCG